MPLQTSSVWVVHGPVVRIEGKLPSNAASLLEGRGAFEKDGYWWCTAGHWPAVERGLRALGIAIGQEGVPVTPTQKVVAGKEAVFDVGSLGDLGAFGDMPPKMTPTWLGRTRNRAYVGLSPYAASDCIHSYQEQGLRVEIRPAVQQLMDRITQLGRETEVALKQTLLPDIEMLDQPLWDFQRRAIAFGDAAGGRFFVADEPGLGKSRSAIGYARHVGAQRILILGPSVSKGNWREEIEAADGRRVQVLGGRSTQVINPEATWIVCNYDILADHLHLLLDWNADLLVCDESHALKSQEAKRSIAAKELSRRTKWCILLSGTPMTNSPMDLWNQLDMLQPRWWGAAFDFGIAFAGGRKTRFGWTFKGSSHADILHARLKHVMIRRLKSEVKDDIPPKTRSIYPVDLHPQHAGRYAETWKEYLDWLKKRRKGTEEEKRKAQAKLLVLGGKLREISSMGRVGSTVDLVEQYIQDGKAPIVFGYFTDPLRAIMLALQMRKLKVAYIDGSVGDAGRDKAKKDFLSGAADVLVGQIEAAGVSINLQSRSDMTITHDFIWDPTKHVQSEDRVNRAGQYGDRTTHIYMVGEKTVEEKVIKRMLEKMGSHRGVLDIGRDFTDSMLNELEREFFS